MSSREVSLATGESSNLLIATANREHGMERIDIWGFSQAEPAEWSRWNRGDELPEYYLEITVFGARAETPYTKQFMLRPGAHTALEMIETKTAGVLNLTMAEEDPKVYLEALNNNIVTPSVVFQACNRGQRVNPAHTITVQPIASLPSVSFDVVDYLDMAAHVQLVPHIHKASTPFGRHDILPPLYKAWEANSAPKSHVDATFPFEMTLRYEDVTGLKKFANEVKLLYFPLRDMNPSANRVFGDQDIVKVIQNRLRRIA
jgi:hypothetical protein